MQRPSVLVPSGWSEAVRGEQQRCHAWWEEGQTLSACLRMFAKLGLKRGTVHRHSEHLWWLQSICMVRIYLFSNIYSCPRHWLCGPALIHSMKIPLPMQFVSIIIKIN
jgi:hypothetical protein